MPDMAYPGHGRDIHQAATCTMAKPNAEMVDMTDSDVHVSANLGIIS